jgi:hypothetical protein
MWRDPLCELIQELDRLVPPAHEGHTQLQSFAEVQWIVHTLLEGTEVQRDQLLNDPVYLRMSRGSTPVPVDETENG